MTATETRQHPRAGKRVGDVDWEHVSRTPLLRLHGAFILGIVDPVPMPSPMSEEDGQWIREHAWTKAIRDIDDVYPYGFYRWCSCQRGSCWNCLSLRCDICVHRQTPPKPDTSAGTVTDRHGFVIALIVHRAGETPCRWVCKCAHSAVSAAAPAPDMPAPSPPRRTSRRPVEPVAGQADLFEAVGR